VTLNLHELPDGNGESANGKTEYDERDPGAHPSKKGALIGKVIGDAFGVFAGCGRVVVGYGSRHESSEDDEGSWNEGLFYGFFEQRTAACLN
jgi:hypothetical protein